MLHLHLAVGLTALLPACSAGLGDFCETDEDCKSGLRCSTRDGKRGICTYPEGVPDAALPDTVTPDVTSVDAEAGTDKGADLARDHAVDAPLPDATLPDATLPDATLPDATLPDATLPDAGGAD